MGRKTLLFIGRIHPKKGLRELIEGLAIIKSKNPDLINNWHLKIAGWDQLNHTSELSSLITTLGLDNIVELVGPTFGEQKKRLLAEADAFILPSFSEGLPMSVLEAWAYAIPVVMTPQCNIPEGFKADAAFRCNPTPESIADSLTDLFSASPARAKGIGLNGRQLVERSFTWNHIADETIRLYETLLSQ